MNRKKFIYSIGVAAVIVILSGCKPTENNYRQAYDAAKAKREAANAEAMVPATGLLSDDGISLKVIEGDSVYVSRDRLRRDPETPDVPKAYNVAVGVYKMNTNAKAQASALSEKGYDAHAVMTTGDRWYTVAGCFDSLDEARSFIKDFKKKNPGYPYIGLPGSPIVIGK
ncbi:MAG: SPOR domain-containing protein [Muribaculaceae bacterium]|nr:SPOR domain-containing protein [Muribaculaceae bacterium]